MPTRTSRLGFAQLGHLQLSQLAVVGGAIERLVTHDLGLVQQVGNQAPGSGNVSTDNPIGLVSTAISANQLLASASNALALNSTATAFNLTGLSASSSLALGQSVNVAAPLQQSASNALALTQTARQGIINVSASSALAMVHEPYAGQPRLASAANTFTLTDTTLPGIFHLSASSALALTQEGLGDTVIKERSAASALSLVSTATADASEKFRIIADEMFLLQVALANSIAVSAASQLALTSQVNNIFDVSVASALSLGQVARASPVVVDLQNQFTLAQILQVRGPVYATATTPIRVTTPDGDVFEGPAPGNLTHAVQAQSSIINIELEQFFSLSDKSGRMIDASASSILALAQTAQRTYAESHNLGLLQVSVGNVGKAASSILALNGAVNVVVNAARPASTTMQLLQGAGFTLIRPDTDCDYRPFLGTSSPVSPTPPLLSPATLTLTHPFVAPMVTLVLRNPDFGNLHRMNFTRINRTTRGGIRRLFSDPIWPKNRGLVITVSNLKEEEAQGFLTFLVTSLGQEIGLLDHENRLWRGIITTPDAEVTTVSKHNRSISFEFEGQKA